MTEYTFVASEINQLRAENIQLKTQIEKMRNCFNCEYQTIAIDRCKLCDDFDLWELKCSNH